MPSLIDLVGKRFGRLVVTARAADVPAWPGAHWTCVCDCGRTVRVYGQSLRRGSTLSCGCLGPGQNNLQHGSARDDNRKVEYNAWLNMRQRCRNPKHPQYGDYGGRGITVDPRWDSFQQFFDDVGPRPTALHSIDRIDNEKGYGPDNCHWATRSAQNRNRRDVGIRSSERVPEYIEDCVLFLEARADAVSSEQRQRLGVL